MDPLRSTFQGLSRLRLANTYELYSIPLDHDVGRRADISHVSCLNDTWHRTRTHGTEQARSTKHDTDNTLGATALRWVPWERFTIATDNDCDFLSPVAPRRQRMRW